MTAAMNKSYGDFARADIRHHHGRMKKGSGESLGSFAARLYSMQMEIYSAYAGRDLETPWPQLGEGVRKHWIAVARQRRGGVRKSAKAVKAKKS